MVWPLLVFDVAASQPLPTHLHNRGLLIEPGAIFALLEHLMEGATLPDCEAAFGWVEAQRPSLAVPQLWNRGKLILLRTCNNLLRRLSRAAHTVFCGRVLLLLAALFPLSERSALNITGAYNRGNVTTWDAPEVAAAGLHAGAGGAGDGPAEEGEVDTGAHLDGAFYDSFWALQHTFSHMPSALPAAGWARFAAGAELLLSAFELDPVPADSVPHNSAPLGTVDRERTAAGGTGGTPKYLTSATLLRLELRDPAFRRALLLQLTLTLRFAIGPPSPTPPLKGPALEQAGKLAARAAACLSAVPPDGPAFLARVESALERDRNWVAWKATGCKDLFERAPQGEAAPAAAEEMASPPQQQGAGALRKRRAPPPRDAHYTVRLGNGELDRLWNEHRDLNEAAKSSDRGVPSHSAFLEPIREQLDPAWCAEMDIEEGMKRKHDKAFCWKALRLVCRANLGAFTKAAEREGGADMDNITREVFSMPRAPSVKSPPPAAALGPGDLAGEPGGAALVPMDVDARLAPGEEDEAQRAPEEEPAVEAGEAGEGAADEPAAEEAPAEMDAATDGAAAGVSQEQQEEEMLAAMEAEAAAAEADAMGASPPSALPKKRSVEERDA